MKTRTKRILWLTPAFIAAAYTAALIGVDSEPSGYVASYSFYPHDGADILAFSRGAVTQKTCCGEEPFGTYSRKPDGTWIWHLRHSGFGNSTRADGSWVWHIRTGSEAPLSREMLARTHLFYIDFTDTKDPSFTFTLRRRVFRSLPL